jgi:predicted Zn-dependent peptidase
LLLFTLVTEPDRRTDAVAATLAEVSRVRTNGITATQMERAKTELKRQYLSQGESVTGQAGALGFYEMIATYEFATEYLDRIDKITLADVKRVASKYLSTTDYIQAVIDAAPPRQPGRPLGGEGSIPA